MNNLLVELGNANLGLTDEGKKHLKDFLSSTMDEARMISQTRLSKSELASVGLDDWEYFRDSIVKRELNNVISYEKQRDHGSHTIYNYLMGLYIYQNTDLIKNSFVEHIQIRKYKGDFKYFESLWPYVSLLHDIGYMFEGSISNMEVSNNNDLMVIGSNILNAYFDNIFWVECGVYSVAEMSELEKLADLTHPHIDRDSIYTLTNSLRNLGAMGKLQKNTNRSLARLKMPPIKAELSSDAFDVWIQYLEYFSKYWTKLDKSKFPNIAAFGNPFGSMIKRIKELRKYYLDLLVQGNKKILIRNIDHGVASGLVSLKCSTLFFQLHNAIELSQASSKKSQSTAVNHFTKHIEMLAKKYNYDNDSKWWWMGVIWATMAAAYHNFPLMREYWPNNYSCKKLSIHEDPLTYLGIMVDIIQEWDRYSTTYESYNEMEIPLQGKDMRLGRGTWRANKIVRISYPKIFPKKKLKEIEKKLDDNLLDWKKIIKIETH